MVINTDIVVAIITGVCGIAAGYLSGGLVKRNNKNYTRVTSYVNLWK